MSATRRPETIGRYQITSTLGEGAMGVVYKAHDPLIGRMVAIKTVRTDTGMTDEQHEDFIRRFIQEARIAGTLSHSNIVTIYDVGQDQESPFIAMEYLEGQSLLQLISSSSSPFTPTRLINLLSQMARGLDYAHEQNVVHRDVKPGNIMVLPGDQVKLMDFGIAKIPGLDTTQTGVFLGSPNYTAPEQIVGSTVDRRADIFSLGIVAFELLTGALPFPGDTITAILYSIVHQPPRFPDHRLRIEMLDDRWRAVFGIVLDKNPDRRFQRAEAFIEALSESVIGRVPPASDTGPTDRTTVLPAAAPPRDTAQAPAAPPGDVFRTGEEVEDNAGAMDLRYRPLVPGDAAGTEQAAPSPAARRRRFSPLRVGLTLIVLLLVLACAAAATLHFGPGREAALCLLADLAPPADDGSGIAALLADWLDDPELRPVPHRVRLTSEPAGAAIRFGLRDTGRVTPAELTLPFARGARNLVTLTSEGYLPGHVPFAIGESPPAEIALTLQPDLEELDVRSTPAGATVTVDGQIIEGRTPLKLRLDRGTVKVIRLALQGHEDQAIAAADLPPAGTPLDVTLPRIRGPGTLVIRSPFPVTASLGRTALHVRQDGSGRYRASLASGRRTVTIRNRQYYHYEKRTFEIPEGGSIEHRIASPGRADITAIPGNCKIHIDGAYVDFVPIIGLPLAAGTHRARFTWPADGATREKRFRVAPGETVKVFMSRD